MENDTQYDILADNDENESSKEETPIELLASCFGLRQSPEVPRSDEASQNETESPDADFSNFKIQINRESPTRKLSDETSDSKPEQNDQTESTPSTCLH